MTLEQVIVHLVISKNLPADTIKIDMSFVRDIHLNEDSQAIVKAIVALADTVGLNVIAEGMEYEEQAVISNEFRLSRRARLLL